MNKDIVTLPKKGLKKYDYNIDMEKKDLKKLSKSQLIKILLKQEKKKSEIIVVDDTKPNPPPRTGKWKNVKPKPVPRKSVKQMVKEYEDIIQPPEQFRDGYKPIPKPRTDRHSKIHEDHQNPLESHHYLRHQNTNSTSTMTYSKQRIKTLKNSKLSVYKAGKIRNSKATQTNSKLKSLKNWMTLKRYTTFSKN